MQLVIHKGTHEIGGTCIQLTQDDFTILLDLGRPLAEGSRPIDVSVLKPDAIFISHSHEDHYGLIEEMDSSIPVYTSELVKRLVDAARIFSGRPELSNEFHFFERDVPVDIGPFAITPYLADHSAPDAFSFLVKAGGSSLFYSGDLRAHGRKNLPFDRLVGCAPQGIDVLLMEGTMLDRTSGGFDDEDTVENAIVEAIRDQGAASFVICSSQNVDRLVGAFRACLRTGKTLVVDAYTEWVLEQMKLVTDNVPNMFWDKVKVVTPNWQYEVIKGRPDFFGDFQAEIFEQGHVIKGAEIQAVPADYLQAIRLSGAWLIKRFLGNEPVNVIYSQWLGYLEDEGSENAGLLRQLKEDPRVNFVYAHTTGHAFVEDLKLLTETLCPRMVIPIHTQYPDEFVNHFRNVVVLDDGQELAIPKKP